MTVFVRRQCSKKESDEQAATNDNKDCNNDYGYEGSECESGDEKSNEKGEREKHR